MGKISATWKRRCEVLWLGDKGGDQRGQSQIDVNYPRLHFIGMSASHTTPSPSTGLASGGVPTEAS
jgi:hypothetical protein